MGKRGGARGGRGRGGRGGMGRDDRRNGQGDFNKYSLENMVSPTFEEYYKTQNIVPEGEWDAFMGSLRTELPTTFRVTGSRAHADTINDLIKDVYVPSMIGVEFDGIKYDPPKPLPWYPNGLGWEVAAPKRVIRKQPAFKTFQRFLVGETEVGNLSRQEAVSMIPPLLMDVEPHHKCLDMCAAPGSKTAQIIEALNPHHTESTGLLIANDSDYKRTHMLVHQTSRMPSKALLVMNCDAAMFPNISLGDEQLKFDRILADVPCSGDGTLRKNLEIWKKWAPSDGNSLHIVQLRILHRAMNMLKPGGRLVYSTCSFNPSENEAVVAAALNAHPGEFTIVDSSDRLAHLKRHPGITSWKVGTTARDSETRETVYHETYEDYIKTVPEDEQDKDKIATTLWPPANATELGLEHCLRLLPHDQNTGGFFVCVLEKKAEPSAVPEGTAIVDVDSLPEPAEVETMDEKGAQSLKRAASPTIASEPDAKKSKPTEKAEKKKKPDLSFREDPFSFVDPAHEEVQSVAKWFSLHDNFPSSNLLVRNEYGNPLRTMYIVNDVIKAIVQNNDYTRLRMISAGVKAFVRQDSQARNDIQCKWRVSADGIAEVLKYTDSIVTAGLPELRIFLEEMYPPIDRFASPFKELLLSSELGNMLVRFEAGEGAGGKLTLPLSLPVWKAKQSMSLLVDKREKAVLSERTFGEDICKPAPKPRPAGLPVVSEPATAIQSESEAVDSGVEVEEAKAEEAAAEPEAAPADEEAALNA